MFKFESVSTCGSLKLSVEKTKTKVITETNQNKDLLRHYPEKLSLVKAIFGPKILSRSQSLSLLSF